MGKKVKEYKSGDFIFAKVKGYPAWPARVQKPNGKKYFVYFYGTGETANLPPNMIFDYAENKEKFLTKTVKRRDFNDGVKQIEHDFANNVPLELVIGALAEAVPAQGANDTANDTGNDTMDDSAIDTTTADDTIANTTAGTQNATQNDTAVEDSDEAGTLVIDEGKAPAKQPRKSKAEPAKTPKTPKTPRGKAKKDEDEEKPEEAKEELVSRSGRKIRPKRYIDEQTEDNATLPSPAPKKRRGASPPPEKEKEPPKEKASETKEKSQEKDIKQFNNVPQVEIEDLKEPFKSADADKENILVARLPSGQYCGVKLFQSRPANFKDDAARLQWDKQAATNAITLKNQLEKGEITPQSITTQLVMDLNLTDEEKASLDKERETDDKQARVSFLKTEMKLIEIDAKIKACLSLEKADVEECLKLLDELMELELKPLMMLKHPCCVDTVRRMRSYVGNAPRWQLSESDALLFASRAHLIRKQADRLYTRVKNLFPLKPGLAFTEQFSVLLSKFQQATTGLGADQLLELVREPAELSQPSEITMQAAIDAANKEEPPLDDDDIPLKKKSAKPKKAPITSTPAKPAKRNSRKQDDKDKGKEKEKEKEVDKIQENDEQMETNAQEHQQNDKEVQQKEKEIDKANDIVDANTEKKKEKEKEPNEENNVDQQTENAQTETNNKQDEDDSTENEKEVEANNKTEDNDKVTQNSDKKSQVADKKSPDTENSEDGDKKAQESNKKNSDKEFDKKEREADKKSEETNKKSEETNKKSEETNKKSEDTNKKSQDKDKKSHDSNKKSQENDKKADNDKKKEGNKRSHDGDKKSKDTDKKAQENDKEKSEGRETRKDKKKEEEKQKQIEDEPRAKRSRAETKKTEPPPRSPAKRKSKA